MSGHYPPLNCKDVKKILANLGFQFVHQRGSHEKWQKKSATSCWTVIVDCPNAPFTQTLISSMASQAGVTKKQFYAALG
jgi:predicted RNA binding protein YcfA (HicA-like mRNA interferase family)